MNELATMGHHCKHTKGGACKCKCNTLFKGTYNPRSLSLYDHTIDPALTPVDVVTVAPTSFPTIYPTPYPTPNPTPYPTPGWPYMPKQAFQVGGKSTVDLGMYGNFYTHFNLARFEPSGGWTLDSTFRMRCWDGPASGGRERTFYLKGLANPSQAFNPQAVQDLTNVVCSSNAEFSSAGDVHAVKYGPDCMGGTTYRGNGRVYEQWATTYNSGIQTYWGNREWNVVFGQFGKPGGMHDPWTLRNCGISLKCDGSNAVGNGDECTSTAYTHGISSAGTSLCGYGGRVDCAAEISVMQ
jgi:hypothetical protein